MSKLENWFEQIKDRSNILVCEDFILWKNEALKWTIELVIDESLSLYDKALLDETNKQWYNNYKELKLEEKAIEKISKGLLERLQRSYSYFDHSLLEFEKHIFIYALKNNLYSEDELNSIANNEPYEYFEYLKEKYENNNIKKLIDNIRNLSEQKKIIAVHTSWDEEIVTDDPDHWNWTAFQAGSDY